MALAGIVLMMLARGVLRGQRRAWAASVLLLAGTLILHLVHGASVSGLVVTVGVLGLLLVERAGFQARPPTPCRCARPSPPSSWRGGRRRGVRHGRHRVHGHRPAPRAPDLAQVVAGRSSERLVGITSRSPCPTRSTTGCHPGLLAVGIGLVPSSPSTCSPARWWTAGWPRSRPSSGGRGAPSGRARRHRPPPRRPGPSTTSPCATTSSGSSTATAWWPTPSTAGSASSPPTPSGPRPSGSRSGAPSAASPTATAGRIAVHGGRRGVAPHLPRLGHAQHLPRRRGGRRRPGLLPRGRQDEGAPPGPQPHREVRLHASVPRPVADRPRAPRRRAGRPHGPQPPGRARAGLLDDARPHLRPPRHRAAAHRGLRPRGARRRPCASSSRPPAIDGYSLDLMRRDPGEHPNGLLDFALCSTIEHLRGRGPAGAQPQLRRHALDPRGREGRRARPSGSSAGPCRRHVGLRPDRVAVEVQRQVRAGVAPPLRASSTRPSTSGRRWSPSCGPSRCGRSR